MSDELTQRAREWAAKTLAAYEDGKWLEVAPMLADFARAEVDRAFECLSIELEDEAMRVELEAREAFRLMEDCVAQKGFSVVHDLRMRAAGIRARSTTK